MTDHQLNQIQVINDIEAQIKRNSIDFTTVSPVEDFENDPRICLTSVHFPSEELLTQIQDFLIEPLRKIDSEFFYYPPQSLHMTIKNLRVIHDPPLFSKEDVEKAEKVFSKVILKHKKFKVYFYRLLLFPNNLVLLGTTDGVLDEIILDLDESLSQAGIADNKKYLNSKYFFCNMTLARFNRRPNEDFLKKVQELSDIVKFDPYVVDSVSLVTGNAVFKNLQVIKKWNLD